MAIERTFAIIKPDAVGRGLAGEILSRIHAAKFQIVAIKSLRLTKTGSRRILRRPPRAPVLRRAHRFHELRQSGRDGPRSGRRHREMARHHGRHRSRQGRARHDPHANSAPASSTIARTVPTRRKPPRSKSATSSPDSNWSKRVSLSRRSLRLCGKRLLHFSI